MFDYLKGIEYPGRGILIGLSESGDEAVTAYFITGRSANSRNRRFEIDGESDLIIYPVDESKVEDPSLIIYSPLRDLGSVTVVTNGDQTDTIAEALARGESFEAALRARCYEPDAPNFTPRISGMLSMPALADGDGDAKNNENNGNNDDNGKTDKSDKSEFSYKLSILKKESDRSEACARFFYEYEAVPGEAHLIHTYSGAEEGRLLSFKGEPVKLDIGGTIEELTEALFDALDGENMISLFVRYIDLKSGETSSEIINKMEE